MHGRDTTHAGDCVAVAMAGTVVGHGEKKVSLLLSSAASVGIPASQQELRGRQDRCRSMRRRTQYGWFSALASVYA